MKAIETKAHNEMTVNEAKAKWGEELVNQLFGEILDCDNYGTDGGIEWKGSISKGEDKYFIAYRYSDEDYRDLAEMYNIEVEEVNVDMLDFAEDEAIFWEI